MLSQLVAAVAPVRCETARAIGEGRPALRGLFGAFSREESRQSLPPSCEVVGGWRGAEDVPNATKQIGDVVQIGA
jgi:hypothetical protein